MQPEKLAELEALIRSDYSNLAGLVIREGGRVIYETYFPPYTADNRFHVFSVTKSIISLLFGIALDKGYIDCLDRSVLDFYPEYTVKRGEKTLPHVTIRDMLTMTAPYKYKSNPYTKYFTSSDWVRFSLDVLGGHGTIGDFRYAPLIGPDILSGILVKATGQSVFDFAGENLFAPLGISVEKNITFHSKEEQMAFYKATDVSGWVAGPTGVNTAGWGLTLAPADMAKIGQLCLNGGVWNGTRLVSEKWIADSTSEHSRWKERNLPYGYLWWIVEPDRSYAAIGDGGNIIYVSPSKNRVIAIASLFYPRAKDRIELIKRHVEPILDE